VVTLGYLHRHQAGVKYDTSWTPGDSLPARCH
jgi:hypothetical protein